MIDLREGFEMALGGGDPGYDWGALEKSQMPGSVDDSSVPAHSAVLIWATALLSNRGGARDFWFRFLEQPWLAGGQGFSRTRGVEQILAALAVHLWARRRGDWGLEAAARGWLSAVFAIYGLSALRGGPYGLAVTTIGGCSWFRGAGGGRFSSTDPSRVDNVPLDSVVAAALHRRPPLIVGRWESACVRRMGERFGLSPFELGVDLASTIRPVFDDDLDEAGLEDLRALVRPLRLDTPLVIHRYRGGVVSFCEWTPRIAAGQVQMLQALVGTVDADAPRLTALAIGDGSLNGAAPAETWIENGWVWARSADGSDPSKLGAWGEVSGRRYGIGLPAGALQLKVRIDSTGTRIEPAKKALDGGSEQDRAKEPPE
ncbi:MAG: hypothetical protein AAGN66_26725 [Acidobacteriota bacterium]